MLDLRAIKSRLAAATPGPWETDDDTCVQWHGVPDRDVVEIGRIHEPGDCDFVVHAREDIDDLIAEVERLRAIEAAARTYQLAYGMPAAPSAAELLFKALNGMDSPPLLPSLIAQIEARGWLWECGNNQGPSEPACRLRRVGGSGDAAGVRGAAARPIQEPAMTPADERAIGVAHLSVQISDIFQRAEQEAQDALRALLNAERRMDDWEGVAKDQRKEIAALEQEIASLVNDLSFAMAAMRAYREHASDMDTVQAGAELLLAALRDLEQRRDVTTPVGRAADMIAELRRDLADAYAAHRAYAGLVTAIRLALEAEEDGDLVEAVARMTVDNALLSRQNGELTHALARMTTQATCAQQRLERLMGALREYGQHSAACERTLAAGQTCSCGLQEYLGDD